ncbi:DUF1365 domain-containing protein [Crenobacter sp. SG2305]|uniref:DUF1365 domain-containing protein n=1 Tax=Crenobacter oryzisoli TaxID=3056844 RepID=UPI0025AA822F|nr:DUF1365 domain-containing protein [Crenobacter sp. SG2305]MDN0082838.1 DUF1365 domain-containing protein [Crenobacter sp. SG2305]
MAAGYLLIGRVMHARLRPVAHRFTYPVFCLRLNLAELASLENRWFGIDRRRPMSLRLRDYGPRDGSDLLAWIRGVLSDAGLPADGEVWLQTFPRLFGYVFNPVSFWYCHDAGGALRAVLAEVNNTFGEHHRYLLSAADGGPIGPGTELGCSKRLHVSPFCEVVGGYRFRFVDRPGKSFVGIDYQDEAGLLLRTSIGGRLQPWTPVSLRNALFDQPWQALAVIVRIHWQALRLWLKRVPFHRKPAAPEHSLSHGPEVLP